MEEKELRSRWYIDRKGEISEVKPKSPERNKEEIEEEKKDEEVRHEEAP